MNAPYFSSEDISKLRQVIDKDCSSYSRKEGISALLQEKAVKTRYASYLLPERPDLSGAGPDADGDDAVKFHRWIVSATPKIPRSVFGDERFWTALCHETFVDYMEKRWGVDQPDEPIDEEDMQDHRGKPEGFGRVSERFFVKGASQRGIVRNGLARLFWAAELASDAEAGYDLAKQMFRKQDIHQSIIERSMCVDAQLTKKMLIEFAALNDEELGKKKIQLVAKLINGAGGTRTLGTVSREDVSDSFRTAFRPRS